MSRLTYDLNDATDRSQLGHALEALTGTAGWAGLESVRRHLEHVFIDRLGKDTKAGIMARMLARLTGDTGFRQAPLQAEDCARLMGQREALQAFVDELTALVLTARREVAQQLAQQAPAEKPGQRMPLGRSPMGA